MMKLTYEMTCAHHPATEKLVAGSCERVIAGRRCDSRIVIIVDGHHRMGDGATRDIEAELNRLAIFVGWVDGMCVEHRSDE